jgi:uncharacterized repeat protein (TIGR03803 family)
LINVNGTLYGTTTEDGAKLGHSHLCCGTVFSVTTAGKEQVLYKFAGGPADGGSPVADLIDVNGTLYGTTAYGGSSGCESADCGTVFSVTTAGKEEVLHSFTGDSDGATPSAGLINVNGTLYGTTAYGGGSVFCNGGIGCGTIFSVTTTGAEQVLHTFAGGSADGANPLADLIDGKGTLYGTTECGGPKCGRTVGLHGCGTVFAFTP